MKFVLAQPRNGYLSFYEEVGTWTPPVRPEFYRKLKTYKTHAGATRALERLQALDRAKPNALVLRDIYVR
jgi:hypothetical protein